jgi:hypothetical protein
MPRPRREALNILATSGKGDVPGSRKGVSARDDPKLLTGHKIQHAIHAYLDA